MKKALLFIIIMSIPVTLLALSPLSDEDLAGISGQSGVSIMPNITMNIHIDVLAWGDSDGLGQNNIWGQNTSGGYFGVTNFTITNLHVGPRTDSYTGLWPLTIDVSNGLIRTSDESYTRTELTFLQYQAMLANLNLR
jgi:hypothetical protein